MKNARGYQYRRTSFLSSCPLLKKKVAQFTTLISDENVSSWLDEKLNHLSIAHEASRADRRWASVAPLKLKKKNSSDLIWSACGNERNWWDIDPYSIHVGTLAQKVCHSRDTSINACNPKRSSLVGFKRRKKWLGIVANGDEREASLVHFTHHVGPVLWEHVHCSVLLQVCSASFHQILANLSVPHPACMEQWSRVTGVQCIDQLTPLHGIQPFQSLPKFRRQSIPWRCWSY